MSNQNKKNIKFIFGHRIWKIHGFFERLLNAPTGVDRRTQKEKKKSWLTSVFLNTTKFRI
jgi:hypothetical protein